MTSGRTPYSKTGKRHRRRASGTYCRHCDVQIRKSGTPYATWVHDATGNIFCDDNLPGLTAKFAEPG